MLFVHAFSDTHLNCLLLDTVNNVTTDMGVYVSICPELLLSVLLENLGVELPDHLVILCFVFGGTTKWLFTALANYTASNAWRFWFFHVLR